MRVSFLRRGSWLIPVLLLLQTSGLAVPLRTGETLVRWGNSRLPPDLSGYTAVADSWLAMVAVRPDGHLDSWSLDPDATALLSTVTNAVDVVLGEGGCLVLLANGSVVAIGQYATTVEDHYHMPFPEDLTNVMAVAALGKHALLLTTEGRVLAAGEQAFGECAVPLTATNVIQIAASWFFSVALRADGTLVGWGAGDVGNLQFPPGLSNVVQVAVDSQNTYALGGDGRLWIFGANQPPGNVWLGASNVVGVAANLRGCFARLGDGTLRTVVGPEVSEWLTNVTALYSQMDSGGAWVRGPLLASTQGDWLHGRLFVGVGTNFALEAHSPGGAVTTFRWMYNGETITNETGSSLSLSNLQPTQTGLYTVACQTPAGELSGPPVELVVGLPRIAVEPGGLDVEAGADVSVSIVAEAAGLLTYAWRVDGEPIESWNARTQAFPAGQLPGSSPVLALSPARPEMSGNYDVVVSTDYGSVTSRVASVRIRTAPVVDAQQMEFGAWVYLRDTTNRYELAQTFTARISGRLERVFLAGGFGEPAQEYPSLFTITDTTANEPGSSVLGRVVVQHLPGSELVSFHGENVFLEANHRYALVIQTDAGPTLGATYSFRVSGADAYADGELWVRRPPETQWTRFVHPVTTTPVDLLFATYCFPGIPEVRVTQPRDGALLGIDQPIEIETTMAPGFVPASEVTFRIDGSAVGSRSAPPWRLSWTPTMLGDIRVDAATTRPDGTAIIADPVRVRLVPPRPANDDFSAPRVLSGENPIDDFTLVGATPEPGETPLTTGAAGETVWWSWTAPRSGRVRVTFLPADPNLVAGVFSGSSVASSVLLNAGPGGCEWVVGQGVSYRLAVDTLSSTPGIGRLALALNEVELDSPTPQAVFTSPARFQVSATRRAQARVLTNVVLELDARPVTNWLAEPFACLLEVVEPGPHELTVASVDDVGITTRSSAVPLLVRPANDGFANAIELAGSHLRTEASNAGATAEGCDPHYGDNQGGHSIWYRWTAPSDGVGVLRGEGLPQGVLLGAYLGSAICSLSEIVANAFAPPGEAVYFNAVAGKTYYVMADGLFGEAGRITWTLDLLPRNDLFAWRTSVAGASHEEFISLSGGPTLEAGESALAPAGAIGSWWWSWCAPQSARVRFRVSSPTAPVAVGVFLGAKLKRLQVVAVSSTFAPSAEVAFSAEAGQEYELAVFTREPAEGMARLELITEALRLISPPSGSTIRLADTVALEARLEIPGEQPSEVFFQSNGALLGSLTQPPFVLAWTPRLPGSYLLAATARTTAGHEFASLPVRVLVYEGEDLPRPHLFSGPSYPGTFVLDATGTLHLFGAPVAAFGNAQPPQPGVAQLGLWPTNVTGWQAVAASGAGPAWSSVPDIGQGPPPADPLSWALSDQGALYYNGIQTVVFPAGVTRFTRLSTSWGYTIAVGDDGGLYVHGGGHLVLPNTQRWADAGFGADYLATLAEAGEVYVYNRGMFGELLTTQLARPPGVERWTALQAAPSAFFLLDDRGEAYSVGASGVGNIQYSAALVTRPGGVSRWRDLAVGMQHVIAIGDDGQLYGWGRNYEGQLGVGAGGGFYSSPQKVPNPPGVTAWVCVTAGRAHTMAIANDCSLYAWGWNQEGELGVAPSAPIFEPVRVNLDAAVAGQLIIFARTPASLRPDGSFALAFPTLLNRRYLVQYTDDLGLWKTAFPPVAGSGDIVEWIDAGPPVTDSVPVEVPHRLYRILLAP